ncbi:protein GET4 [Citrus sinensis]|uniref:Protein GET4 n=1 Tax=Citrus sinensis TaxID=2711 RepID=A0ACB8L3P6_CITSI|nr:protein GET4 [Citrus sinensis]
MSRQRPKRTALPPAQENIDKLEKIVNEGNFYGAQQMYKSISARYVAAQRYSEALDLLHAGACLQLKNNQLTCGAELAVSFVEALVKGKVAYDNENLDRVRKIYELFPQIPVPHNLEDDDDLHELTEALGAAKLRVEGCSSFLKAAIKWSIEFGAPKTGSPELHVMLAEYLYSESPELDMARVSFHFVRGNNPEKFASTIVNFMGKCYPGEDDLAVARAILMLERDALPLFNMLRANYKASIEREPAFNEMLDDIAEKFFGVKRRNPMQGIFGDIFKMM